MNKRRNDDNIIIPALYKKSNSSKSENNEDKSDNVIVDEDKMLQRKYTNNTNISEASEVNNNEFFIKCPVIYLFFKILFIFEGQILRIFIQIGDLYFCAVITNIYLEIILIQVCASAVSNVFIKIYAFISGLIFAFLMKSIVTIAYWELYQLKWFDLNPFNSITELIGIKLKTYHKRNISYIVNIIFGILFWLFIIGFLTMSSNNGKLFDIINLIIFIVIPFLKFLFFYLCYIIICFKNLFCGENVNDNNENPFRYWIKLNNLIDQGVIKVGQESLPSKEKNTNGNNDNNNNNLSCLEKLFFKEILFEIKMCKNKSLKISLKTIFKIFCAILSFIYCIYLLCSRGATVGSVFFLVFVYLISLIISIHYSTPLWLMNSIYRWYLKHKKKYDNKFQAKCRKFNDKFSAFKVLDTIPLVLSILLLIILLCSVIIFSLLDPIFTSAHKKLNKRNEFIETDWKQESFNEKKNIENAICFSSVHGLSLFKISSLAFAVYMNDPENILDYYQKTFFKENNEKITEMRLLNRDSEFSVVMMINLDMPNEKKNLTVFSIQATIKNLDVWVDMETFCSSAMFTIIRILTINKLESLTSRVITWILSIPIRTLEKFTLFHKYIDSLVIHIDKEIEKINGTRNILFTGHSLGGGMAKYMGLKYHKENVAVSGPGITPLEYKFTSDENYYKYYKSNLIDIVADNDLVPRVETSGGVRYRVLCEKNFFDCHQVDRIVCQIGATCRREDLSGDLCMSMFGKKKYQEMRDLAGISSKMPNDYD